MVLERIISFYYDFDTTRRKYPEYYGLYRPSYLKRFVCWIMCEKIHPIDWEECPDPFNTKINEYQISLTVPRQGEYHPFECVSQPNMLTDNNIRIRRFIFFLGLVKLWFHFEKHGNAYNNNAIMFNFIYANKIIKFLVFYIVFYSFSRTFISKENQLPFN